MLSIIRLLFARRALLPSIASVAYVVAVAWRAAEREPEPTRFATFTFAFVALVLAGVCAFLPQKPLAWATFGTSLATASLIAPQNSWVALAGCVGSGVALVAARFASSRPSTLGGLAHTRPRRPWVSVVLVAIAWGCAGMACVRPMAPRDWVVTISAISASLVFLLSAITEQLVRRFELDVVERLRMAAWITGIATLLGVGFSVVFAPHVMSIAAATTSSCALVITAASLRADPERIGRTIRKLQVLGLAAGAVALVFGLLGDHLFAVLGSVVAMAVVALLSPTLEKTLRPHEGALFDALELAHEALLRSAPHDAIRVALSEMRKAMPPDARSPSILFVEQATEVSVDVAGYLHEKDAVVPNDLVRIAEGEPECTLRGDLLEALAVRRPHLRSLCTFMHQRDACSATLIIHDGSAIGAFLVPRDARVALLTLEEVRRLKTIADAFAGAILARTSLTQSLAREVATRARADDADQRADRATYELAKTAQQNTRSTLRFARPAAVGIYSAASRLAYEAIERRAIVSAPVLVHAPPGVDPIPYLARAHLAGPRKDTPFVVVDGTQAREHDLDRWRDPIASPLALADHGVIVLADGPSLPVDVQRLIGHVLAERRAPWAPDAIDCVLIVTCTTTAPPLDPILSARLGDALEEPIEVPSMDERAEDLRAIVIDRLGREGLHLRGRPLGIEDAAFGRLIGILGRSPILAEEAGLLALIQRMAALTRGDVVRVTEMDQLERELSIPAELSVRAAARPNPL